MEDKLMINDVARILRFTSEALRYYDKKGVICPKRDGQNGYRYYTIHDVMMLNDVRKYQNMGLSLKEICEVLDPASGEQLDKVVEEKEAELRKQYEALGLALKKIEEFRDAKRTVDKYYNEYVFRERPHWYFSSYSDIITCGKERRKERLNHPFWDVLDSNFNEFACAMIVPGDGLDESDFDIENGKMRAGYVVDAAAAGIKGLHADEFVEELESVQCMYTTFKAEPKLNYRALEWPLKWISAHGFYVSGSIVCKVLSVDYTGDAETRYYEAWIPVGDASGTETQGTDTF